MDGGKNITIEKNTSYHNGFGIEVGCENIGKSADEIIVKNNILFDNQIAGFALGGFDFPNGSGKVTNSIVRNNTCYYNDFSNSGNGEFYFSYSENCLVENNIFYISDQNILAYADLSQLYLNFNYNTIFCQAGIDQLITTWNGIEYNGFSNFTSGTNTNSNSIFANPQFYDVNLVNPTFTLLENSPCIDSGNPSTIIDQTENDYYSHSRVEGGIVDAGAAEFGSSTGIYNSDYINYSIYPNPASGLVKIISSKLIMSCKIFSTIGPLEFQNFNRNTIDVSNLKPGIYLMVVEIENSSYTKRFVKN